MNPFAAEDHTCCNTRWCRDARRGAVAHLCMYHYLANAAQSRHVLAFEHCVDEPQKSWIHTDELEVVIYDCSAPGVVLCCLLLFVSIVCCGDRQNSRLTIHKHGALPCKYSIHKST